MIPKFDDGFINHSSFERAIKQNEVEFVEAIDENNNKTFSVLITLRYSQSNVIASKVLVTERGKNKTFRSLDGLNNYLVGLGIKRFIIKSKEDINI